MSASARFAALTIGALFAFVHVGFSPYARGDVLIPKRGKRIEGAIVSQAGGRVVFNRYWSRNPGVTNPDHVITLAASAIKSARVAPHPHVEFFRRLKVAKSVDDLVALGDYAREHKLKAHAKRAYATALAKDESNAAALEGIGGASKWKTEREGNPWLDHSLGDLRRKYVTVSDPKERVALAATIKKAGGQEKLPTLERMRRSASQPTGYHVDRPLCVNAPDHPHGVYTLYVPDTYTPTETWPLIIGLHGGGAGGKAGDEVVGSGESAINFYRRHATERGFIVACPDALSRGWGSKDNEQLVRDVITELTLLYNVDLDRIYLTGHSMGGFGTWSLGPRMADLFAAISPMAGAGSGVSKLIDTNTPIFIFHSADDFIDVSSDRAAAKQLKASSLDFVYTEFPNAGHGFPDSVQVELFDFFEPRRLYRKRRKSAWPRSSFLGKVTSTESRFLGDPLAETKADAPTLKSLMKTFLLGGGCSEAVAHVLLDRAFEGTGAAVSTVLHGKNNSTSARASAARLLGKLEEPGIGLPTLRRVLKEKPSRDLSHVIRATAKSVARLEQLLREKDSDDVGREHSMLSLELAIDYWCMFYESKLSGATIDAPDWQRVIPVIADLVSAWAACAREGDSLKMIKRTAYELVLEPTHKVATSPRVREDPSIERAQLAAAMGRAYARGGATDDDWADLFKALSSDERALTAAKAAREQAPSAR